MSQFIQWKEQVSFHANRYPNNYLYVKVVLKLILNNFS